GFQISVAAVDQADDVVGPEFDRRRAAEFVATYRAHCPADEQPPPCRLEIRETIPPHAGLGSGTQLGMACARALQLMSSTGDFSAPRLATRVQRGRRSALGIHGFERGGFLVDGGKLRA